MIPDTKGRVSNELVRAGYVKLPPVFKIGTVEFDTLAALLGSEGSLDLVLVVDLPKTDLGTQSDVRWSVERVARALDAAKSRRALTTVLITDTQIPSALLDDLLQVSRVISISSTRELSGQLAPLLPLILSDSDATETDALERLELVLQRDTDASQLRRFMRDSETSSDKVSERLADWFNASFEEIR